MKSTNRNSATGTKGALLLLVLFQYSAHYTFALSAHNDTGKQREERRLEIENDRPVNKTMVDKLIFTQVANNLGMYNHSRPTYPGDDSNSSEHDNRDLTWILAPKYNPCVVKLLDQHPCESPQCKDGFQGNFSTEALKITGINTKSDQHEGFSFVTILMDFTTKQGRGYIMCTKAVNDGLPKSFSLGEIRNAFGEEPGTGYFSSFFGSKPKVGKVRATIELLGASKR